LATIDDHGTEPPRRLPAEHRIAFQGRPGAYSHMACRINYPELEPLPCHSFEDAFAAVREGQARLAMIPVDNSVAGRVADVHHLLPRGGLHIVGEHFLRVNHQLLGVPGATLETVRLVESHVHAIGQCRSFLRRHGFEAKVVADTAGAAAEVAAAGDPSRAAIASRLAAEIYGLLVLASDIEDAEHNTTRFLVLAREPRWPSLRDGPVITTFTFRVRNRPAALYKALGGFATNGVNMVKLESYIDGAFAQAQFYADIMGHPEEDRVRFAFEELRFFSHNVEILGVYPADPFRERVG
jgi:prephenate dehydratase